LGFIVSVMANQPKNSKKTEEQTAVGPQRRLLRSRDNRVLWGVAGGLAEHLGFSPALVRIAFVVISLFGGAGVLAYLVLAVALPEDDGTGKPVDESVWARLGKVALVCVLVAIGLCLAVCLAAFSAWVTATGHGTVIAAVVIVVGAALVAAAFAKLRRRITPALLTLALVLGIPAGAVAAADIDIDSSVGERTYTPTVVSDVPADGYELGTGQLVVDLRQLPWAKGQTFPVSAHLGIGQMIVSVPKRVCVDGHATGKGGELIIAGDVSHGIDPDVDQGSPTSDAPRLDLEADIQFGQIIVTDEDPDDVERHDSDNDYDYSEELDEQRLVCGR
jgi:phage shock protein PspC (stress-responsive transcriptional regulator)